MFDEYPPVNSAEYGNLPLGSGVDNFLKNVKQNFSGTLEARCGLGMDPVKDLLNAVIGSDQIRKVMGDDVSQIQIDGVQIEDDVAVIDAKAYGVKLLGPFRIPQIEIGLKMKNKSGGGVDLVALPGAAKKKLDELIIGTKTGKPVDINKVIDEIVKAKVNEKAKGGIYIDDKQVFIVVTNSDFKPGELPKASKGDQSHKPEPGPKPDYPEFDEDDFGEDADLQDPDKAWDVLAEKQREDARWEQSNWRKEHGLDEPEPVITADELSTMLKEHPEQISFTELAKMFDAGEYQILKSWRSTAVPRDEDRFQLLDQIHAIFWVRFGARLTGFIGDYFRPSEDEGAVMIELGNQLTDIAIRSFQSGNLTGPGSEVEGWFKDNVKHLIPGKNLSQFYEEFSKDMPWAGNKKLEAITENEQSPVQRLRALAEINMRAATFNLVADHPTLEELEELGIRPETTEVEELNRFVGGTIRAEFNQRFGLKGLLADFGLPNNPANDQIRHEVNDLINFALEYFIGDVDKARLGKKLPEIHGRIAKLWSDTGKKGRLVPYKEFAERFLAGGVEPVVEEMYMAGVPLPEDEEAIRSYLKPGPPKKQTLVLKAEDVPEAGGSPLASQSVGETPDSGVSETSQSKPESEPQPAPMPEKPKVKVTAEKPLRREPQEIIDYRDASARVRDALDYYVNSQEQLADRKKGRVVLSRSTQVMRSLDTISDDLSQEGRAQRNERLLGVALDEYQNALAGLPKRVMEKAFGDKLLNEKMGVIMERVFGGQQFEAEELTQFLDQFDKFLEAAGPRKEKAVPSNGVRKVERVEKPKTPKKVGSNPGLVDKKTLSGAESRGTEFAQKWLDRYEKEFVEKGTSQRNMEMPVYRIFKKGKLTDLPGYVLFSIKDRKGLKDVEVLYYYNGIIERVSETSVAGSYLEKSKLRQIGKLQARYGMNRYELHTPDESFLDAMKRARVKTKKK